jgi:hypothetical protein
MTPEQIAFAKRYGLPEGGRPPPPPPPPIGEAAPPAPGVPSPDGTAASGTSGNTNEIAKVTLLCRAVSLAHVDPNADPSIAYAVQNELRGSTNLFDPKETKLGEQINPDQNQDTNTFTFNVTLALRRPLSCSMTGNKQNLFLSSALLWRWLYWLGDATVSLDRITTEGTGDLKTAGRAASTVFPVLALPQPSLCQ